MFLADSSVWIAHLHHGVPGFQELLDNDVVVMHPFVRGEVALGSMRQRVLILSQFDALPPITVADSGEVFALIDHQRLYGRGIGWVDAHLLASALLDEVPLWTLDAALARVAAELGVGFRPHRR